MLQTIHDRLKGWVAGLVLGAIGLVFVFWGINWTLSAPNYAAKVNGSEISSSEVRTAYQQQLAQFERQSNGAPLDDAARNQIKRKVLDEYVNSEAVVTRADELGYRVSDSDLLKEMAKVPAFQVDGKFDQAHAVAVLKAQGRSVAEIEGLFRRDTKLRQLDSALTQSSFATNTELRQLRTLTRQQRELSWFTVSTAKYTAEATADEAAIKAYYDAHKADYMTPETVTLRYVEVSLAQLESKVKVDDAQLKTFYDEQAVKTPERFTAPEQRRVRHILFQADAKDDAATKAKAEAVLKRAQGGEDFAKLAKEFSQDTGSASQGGDLGMSERKAFVAPFADAAWSMKEGEIRGPVKTQFGYHIIKVDGIQPATVKTFEQAKSDLESEYKRSEAERLFNLAQDQLADAALQNTTDIDVVARKAGLTVHDIPNFSRTEGGGDLGKAAPVLEAAFSQDVLDGRLSPTVEIEKGRGVVLRATDHKLPEQKPLEAVRPAIVAAWKQQKGAELAAAAAADAAKRLNEGAVWEVVAKSLGAAPQPAKFVARTDQAVPLEIRRDAFTGPKPGPKPVYTNLTLENGDGAVLQVSAVREDPNGDAKEQEAQLRRQYAQQAASSESQSYAMAARADAKVSLNPQALD